MSSQPTGPDDDGAHLAALDLGSNSFHLLIARQRGEELRPLDRVREQVQLARGIGRNRMLSAVTRQRALDTLERFGQRLRHIPAARVRAVGTSALRTARNAPAFLVDAQAALGHPIEVIAGHEEARLIYLGVAHDLPDDAGSRLVLDIGGGSTECILGEQFEARETHSVRMGCVVTSRKFFGDGHLTRARFQDARLAAERELRSIARGLREQGWDRAIGASGTIRAAEAVLRANGFAEAGITADGLKALRKVMIEAGTLKRLTLAGLPSDRTKVFPGGVAILEAVMHSLDITCMTTTPSALREGVLYDLIGRIRHEDVRERTIRGFQERYRVDRKQAARVERTALALLAHAPKAWALDPARDGRVLSWAARVHEIGLAVSLDKHHRHGAYLLQHADMPGFSRDDQLLLAALVGCHRRKVAIDRLAWALPDLRARLTHLVLMLRIAVLVHRSRGLQTIAGLRLETEGGRVRLRAPRAWLASHPLTRLDLEAERKLLVPLGVAFEVAEPQT
ncbi:MAG: Ppx/GppA phosphatase family protein [Planctomycetota bacterium]|nr:Ppx/GppA phosphatase family protein [Planctomycetota bacterium]